MPLIEYTVVEMKQIYKNLIGAEVLQFYTHDLCNYISDASHIQLDKNHH